MCTAVSYLTNNHYFGRNLDLDHHYQEAITITPRNYPLHFRYAGTLEHHFAMIGMATVVENYPLYYDATNEHGLSIAGLNFPGNAVYYNEQKSKKNITPFELTPWILSQCRTTDEAAALLKSTNLLNSPFRQDYPLTPLHWIIADKENSITIEPLANGLNIFENPVGILTNNPPFDFHMHNLTNYLNLTTEIPDNRFASQIPLEVSSLGVGAVGLPGDLSSASRFIRAVFTKMNSICDGSENSSVSQFFHILQAVAQTNGCCRTKDGYEKTIYSSCCNTIRGVYYYTTYDNNQITAVDMHRVNLDVNSLYQYPLSNTQQIHYRN